MWKYLVKSFEVISDCLARKVGNGKQMRLGMDPQLASGLNHLLPIEVREALEDQGISHLSHVVDPDRTNLWHQAWKTSQSLNLNGDMSIMWGHYIEALLSSHIPITNREDELI